MLIPPCFLPDSQAASYDQGPLGRKREVWSNLSLDHSHSGTGSSWGHWSSHTPAYPFHGLLRFLVNSFTLLSLVGSSIPIFCFFPMSIDHFSSVLMCIVRMTEKTCQRSMANYVAQNIPVSRQRLRNEGEASWSRRKCFGNQGSGRDLGDFCQQHFL